MRGSIKARVRADGTRVYDVIHDVPSADGRRRQARRTLPTKRAAEAYLAAQLAGVDRGEVRHTSPVTVGEYLPRWLAEHRARIEPSTAQAYNEAVRLRLVPALGRVRLRDLTPGHVRTMVAELVADGRLAPKTINNTVTVLRVALEHAAEDGLVTSNAAASRGRRDRVKLPAEHRELDYLRPDEIAAYLAGCSPAYRPLAAFLLGTGARIGEALALTWADVDWRSGSVVIARSVKLGGAIGSTKGDRARRVVLGPTLVGTLRDHQAVAAEHDLAAPSALVFPGQGGGHRDRGDVSKRLHRDALKAAGLRQTIRLHDLRHSAVAAWIAGGLPLVFAQRQLGHSTIATTERHYGHLAESYIEHAAVRADAAVFGAAAVRDMGVT